MNIQAMMQQAQKLQKNMLEAKKEIDLKEFVGESSFVIATLNGKKEVVKIQINQEQLDKEDIEMLQDILVVAINNAISQIDKETEQKMGKYTQGMPGLF